MIQPMAPMMMSLVPDSAPFTDEQRAWLNGFFAGMVSPDGAAVTALSPEESAALMPETDDDAPWHDQTLPMAERMKLAEGRPLKSRLMAAMAQQDCGQCGYNCRDYSAAIFAGQEERLNLCVPGGKQTQRMLRTLCTEVDTAAPAATSAPGAPIPVPTALRGQSRDNPAEVAFLTRTRLNKAGSEKETWHVEFDLAGSGIDYAVGDSFGIFPLNDPQLVDAIINALGANPNTDAGGRSLRNVLLGDVSLSPAPDSLFQLISYLTGGDRRQKAKALAAGDDPDGDAQILDVLAAIEKFAGIHCHPEAFVEALEPLQPRLYSISSSPLTAEGRVSLTVDAVRYEIDGRMRLGSASTFLAERAVQGTPVRAYIQKANAFGLPQDPATPIIMIGPGTGVAPFRAFLHERMAAGARGRNWLFFGHQRSACDFFYEDEFTGMRAAGVLSRLTLAWSRDGAEKIYVQDRMREVGGDLWSWLAEGAHLYVCGDAQRMAKDVERALVDVVAQFGARSTDEAIAFVAELKRNGRYQRDVY